MSDVHIWREREREREVREREIHRLAPNRSPDGDGWLVGDRRGLLGGS